MTLTKLLASDGFVCINKAVMKKFGIIVALVLGEICAEYNYWEAQNGLDEEGYFFSTLDNIEEETTVKKDLQNKVFKILKSYGVIDTVRKNMPARRYVKINEDNLFDFLQFCTQNVDENPMNDNLNSTEIITENCNKTSTENCTLEEKENTQFTVQTESSLRCNRNQDYDTNGIYIYNKNNNNNKNNTNSKIKNDKSFFITTEILEPTKTLQSFKQDKNSNKMELTNSNQKILGNFKEESKITNLLEKVTNNNAPLNDLINTNKTKKEKTTETDKKVKPYKLKDKSKEKKHKKPLGNVDRQFELIDIYFNNGETCNRPDIASLVKQFLTQRIKKIGFKNYSDTRWENQLKLLIENAEGDYEYMKEIINTSILRDYNDITFPNQKKSLHQFKPQTNRAMNSFDTAKDNIKNKGVALFNEKEKEDFMKNLAVDENGNPIEF